MNAQTRGREEGFTVALTYMRITKEQFEKIAQHHANHTYGQPKKREKYFQGFMENWHEPHPQDCSCKECQNAPEVLTY